MSLLHVAYALVVGALLTGAASLVEGALRGAERPARMVWVVALVATVTAPWWGPRMAADTMSVPTVVELAEAPTGATVTSATAPSFVGRAGAALATPLPALPWLWLALAGLGVGAVAVGLVRLERRAAGWPRTRIDGEEVSVSRDFGPALVGLVHPRTVLPRWALELARRELGLILAHERAHRSAGDGAILALGLLAAAACPWNPLVWWQFRRLRDAVEMDCDRRLLRGGVSAPAYARVLVLVRLRAAAPGGATAALVESNSSLERRLKTMRAFPWTRPRVALTGAVALGLVAVACETPAPSPVEVETETGDAAAQAEMAVETKESAAGVLTRMPGGAPDAPLIVIDGVIVRDAVLGDLATYDIKSIEVIKGGAARELYGERAAHGVVHITTKDGADVHVEEKEAPIHLRELTSEGDDVEVPIGVFRLRELPEGAGGETEVPFGPTMYVDGVAVEKSALERRDRGQFTVTEVRVEPTRGGGGN